MWQLREYFGNQRAPVDTGSAQCLDQARSETSRIENVFHRPYPIEGVGEPRFLTGVVGKATDHTLHQRRGSDRTRLAVTPVISGHRVTIPVPLPLSQCVIQARRIIDGGGDRFAQ